MNLSVIDGRASDELKQLGHDLFRDLRSWKKVVEELSIDIPPDNFRKQVARYVGQQVLDEEVPEAGARPLAMPMYHRYPVELDDTPKWDNFRKEVMASQQIVSIAILSDIHVPDHNTEALQLSYNILRYLQPTAVLYNGDQFDFDLISRFARHRRRTMGGGGDILDEVRPHWLDITQNVKRATPRSIQVAFAGNHDERLELWLSEQASVVANTVERAFVSLMRANGNVWWLGQYHETHLGETLKMKHGTRVGEKAAQNSLQGDASYAYSISQGHNHTAAMAYRRINTADSSKFRINMAMSVGCLCNIPPAYVRTKEDPGCWVQGMGLIHLDPVTGSVNMQNVLFHRDEAKGRLYAVVGKDVIYG